MTKKSRRGKEAEISRVSMQRKTSQKERKKKGKT
jgi:hypothetical protein